MKTSKDGCLFDVPAAIYGTPRRDRPVPRDAVPISHVVAIACGAPCMDAAEVESADAGSVRRSTVMCVWFWAHAKLRSEPCHLLCLGTASPWLIASACARAHFVLQPWF